MSRYDDADTTTLQVTDAAGARRLVRCYRRRFPPDAAGSGTLAEHLVAPGDRLDLVSFRYTGDPLGFWRICDANDALDPDDLTGAEAVGTEIVVPFPGVAAP
ncbi:hypothetical protein [Myceligenerans crystallogenes]|uniref:LysM domain-containing protein n=1 Tax=Myceligenerans crystallogenes TaxID=316335 RepID=A0ABN2N855_9MICO